MYVPTGVPGELGGELLPPPPPQAANSATAKKIAQINAGRSRALALRFTTSGPALRPSTARRNHTPSANVASSSSQTSNILLPPEIGRTRGSGSSEEGAVVVTVMLTVWEFFPSSVTELGDTSHVASDGAPEQVRDTVWLNPTSGPTVSE